MIFAAAALVLVGLILLPRFLVQRTIARHGKDRPDLPGTGGELARHLLDGFGLADVKLERSETGDHYDPQARAVRLIDAHMNGRSLSAVAVAAHEVGHALQHANGEKLLAWRQRLARIAMFTDRVAGVFFLAAPFLAILARTPLALAVLIGAGIALLSVRVIVNLITLPVEFDASFRKALPILEEGAYLKPADLPAARSVLRAAAYTYVAGALATLVDLARWIRLLR